MCVFGTEKLGIPVWGISKLPCRALKCCEGNSMIEVELPEKLQGAKNYCVCLELEEEEPIFEAIID